MVFDIIVIGAGTSGMTASLYALRAEKSVLLIEKEGVGGQIANSPLVENYPSIKSISGAEFSDALYTQVSDLGAQFEFDEVKAVKKVKDIFEVTTTYSCFKGRSIIIATGVKHRHLGLSKEEELVGKGISYCAVCDGAFYKGDDVCIVGDGNTALQYAILLSSYCKKVYLNTLFDKFFGEQKVIDQVLKRDNIIVEHNLNLVELLEKNGELAGLLFENTQNKTKKTFDVKACFVAIGHIPNNSIFKDLVQLNKAGYIITNDKMETKTSGVYACGDCREKSVRQLTTAVNDGTIAALSACSFLDNQN